MSDNGWRHRVIERKRMRVGNLLPNKHNPVGHGAGQKSRMQAVLDKFGVVTELVAYYNDDGKLALFDGHLRQGLDPGQEWDVAITDLSQLECDELALYFDPLAGMSTPDGAIMTALMQDLQDVDGVLGEMLEELASEAGIAFADEPPEDPGAQVDKAAELQEKWQVERGQVWEMPGKKFVHRLFVGPASEANINCDFAIFDPPFDWSTSQQNMALAWVTWKSALLMGLRCAMALAERKDWLHWWVWDAGVGRYGGKGKKPVSSCVICFLFGEKHFYPVQALAALDRHKIRHAEYPLQIVRITHAISRKNRGEDGEHIVGKPYPLADYIISLYSVEDDIVGDPFAGGGVFLIAAEHLGRQYHGAEIEPVNCAIMLERYFRTFGLLPVKIEG